MRDLPGFEGKLRAEGRNRGKGEDGSPESGGREQQNAAREEGHRWEMHGC